MFLKGLSMEEPAGWEGQKTVGPLLSSQRPPDTPRRPRVPITREPGDPGLLIPEGAPRIMPNSRTEHLFPDDPTKAQTALLGHSAMREEPGLEPRARGSLRGDLKPRAPRSPGKRTRYGGGTPFSNTMWTWRAL